MLKTLAVAAALAALSAGAANGAEKPKLVVAISVDQFSADLFAEYRQTYQDGMRRLTSGVVFPSGYQSHAATETCPGHSTILTGDRPSRTGVIANDWYEFSVGRADKQVYCAEDPAAPGSDHNSYVVSVGHLRVPTLGDRMKQADPRSRVVSVSGKDRAAVMMGGHDTDQIWYWGGSSFVTFDSRKDRPVPATIAPINARAAADLAVETTTALPDVCRSRSMGVPSGDRLLGVIQPRAAGDVAAFRASPEFDDLTTDAAIGLIQEMKLGRGPAPDLLAIGLSATDYTGHRYGTEGAEMCAQMMDLDRNIGRILSALDATGVSYVVVLTADHGGHDAPERHAIHAIPDAQRVDPELNTRAIGDAVAAQFGLQGRILYGGAFGDIYLSPDVPDALRSRVLDAVKAKYLSFPQVEAVFTAEELRRAPHPDAPATEWSLLDRFKESYDAERSGDLLVALKPDVTPISAGGGGTVATHGSPWNYDRRVPIVFYRPGETGFEQPLPVETVDIAPSLAALIGLALGPGDVDGRCLDLDASLADSCAP